MTLDEIGRKWKADKSSLRHDYLNTYEVYLYPVHHRVLSVLEIGVRFGNSIRMWSEYFPSATIYGVDNDRGALSKAGAFPKNCEIICADAAKSGCWLSLSKRGLHFDVIVDDGSHFSCDIKSAIKFGWPLLNRGGFWIVEDLHQVWRNEASVLGNAYSFLFGKVKEMGELGKGRCGKQFDSDIAFVHFYKSLAVLNKRAI